MPGSVTVDRLRDGWLAGPPVYLADLERCSPGEALSPAPALRHWRALPFTAETCAGTMLLAGPETAAPDVTYPLDVQGWHAISIGVYAEMHHESRAVRARLTGEESFTYLATRPEEGTFQAEHLLERFWKIADLTNRQIELGQVSPRVGSGDEAGSFTCTPANIAYIKIVPLSPAEVEAHLADEARTDRRRVFAHNDAHGYLWNGGPLTVEEIQREVAPFADSDVARIYWEAAVGDLTFYPSAIGHMPTADGVTDFMRVGDHTHARAWRHFRDEGIDPLRIAAETARSHGIEFHPSYRVAGFHFPAPIYDSWNAGGFYLDHPEFRCVSRDGNSVARLSYAYPETRQLVISLLREIASYPVDGVALLFNRRPPLLEYEAPLVDGFRAEYGLDPRTLDEHDHRWLRYRAGFLTTFMRELRAGLDATDRELGRTRPTQISAVVLSSEAENLYRAMDLRAWVAEGLVNTVIPYTSAPNLDSAAEAWGDPASIEFFTALVSGTDCVLAPNLMPRYMAPAHLRRRARELYDAGVTHLFAWDGVVLGGRALFNDYWDALRRLGHRDEIMAWTEAGEPSLTTTTMRLLTLGDWDMTYATPG